MNKNLIISSIIIFLIVPFVGINFLLSFISNIFILLLLVPLIIFIIVLLSINSLKSKVIECKNCGSTILSTNEKCMYCGAPINNKSNDEESFNGDASQKTIEIDAEEIK